MRLFDIIMARLPENERQDWQVDHVREIGERIVTPVADTAKEDL